MAWLNKSRNLFLLQSFAVGACAPAVWVCIRLVLKDVPDFLPHSEMLGWVLYSVYFVTFPTQIVFLDAERLKDALFLSVFVAPFDGAWYVILASLFLIVRDAMHRLRQRVTHGHVSSSS